MGVLPCTREGCSNVMCDRHSPEHGHICEECFGELVSMGPDQNIEEFMETPKDEWDHGFRVDQARAKFSKEFLTYAERIKQ